MLTSLGHRIIVRYARKPIYMPTAPSKLFRIPEHTFYDEEECRQIRRLQVVYDAQMESIRKFAKREFYIPATQAGGLPAEFVEQEQKEEIKLLEENERINADVAKRREEYFDLKMKELEKRALEEKMAREEALLQAAEEVDELIRKYKSDPESFITPENFDTMMEKVIDNPVSHEFFIDKQGKRHGMNRGVNSNK